MQLFDAHCHLQDERLAPQLEAVMARAAEAGVTRFLCCGSAESDWAAVAPLAKRFAGVRPSLGLHPWYVRERTAAWLDTLRARLLETGAAVGEIGLDHVLDRATHADQEAVFLAQLDLAAELGRPVSVHCRQAWGRVLEILEARRAPPAGLMVHSFSGSPELVPRLTALGVYVSFSCSLARSGNTRGRRAAPLVRPDRLLAETDSPDIPPPPRPGAAGLTDAQGRPLNEPANLPLVVATLAELRGETVEETARRTRENAERLFGGPGGDRADGAEGNGK
jgi:TatD DNase family protein